MKKKGVALVFFLLVSVFGMNCVAGEYDFSGYRPDPKEGDHYVVYHLKPLGVRSLTYHKSVFFMAAILSKNQGAIPGASGYYLNRSKFSPDGVRLTIFLQTPGSGSEVTKWIAGLTDSEQAKVVPYVTVRDGQSLMTKYYEGSEQSFRRYLSLFTPILLECMQSDFKKCRREFTSLMDQGGMDVEFLEKSGYFMSLSPERRSEFVASLYYNRKWTHMAINFVLGYDDVSKGNWKDEW